MRTVTNTDHCMGVRTNVVGFIVDQIYFSSNLKHYILNFETCTRDEYKYYENLHEHIVSV